MMQLFLGEVCMEKKHRKLPSSITASAPDQLMRGEDLLVQIQCCVLVLVFLPPYVISKALYNNMWTYKLG